MGGISRHIVVEYNVLFRFAALDNLLCPCVQFGFNLIDDRNYKRRQKRKDECIQLLCVSLASSLLMRQILAQSNHARHMLIKQPLDSFI